MLRDAATGNCNRPGHLEARHCHGRILECGPDSGTRQQVDVGQVGTAALAEAGESVRQAKYWQKDGETAACGSRGTDRV